MEIKGEYRIAAGRRTVWDALNDPLILQKCIPGCESLERAAANEYHGRIAAAIGPVRAKFDTQIKLENLNPPEGYTLSGESKGGTAGFGRGSADVRLAEADGATLLTYSANFNVGGKLAQVGSRLVAGTTRKMADSFFGCLAAELEAGQVHGAVKPAGEPDVKSAAATGGHGWIAVAAAVALAALLIGWFLLG
ncbi:MAG TPA: carbon monoxide dehydrogenase subunit G [Woeseiaceae bacterium]|nr:carbon monoxide dehydrogenase subunit G [Woeseiaceae bacterium]